MASASKHRAGWTAFGAVALAALLGAAAAPSGCALHSTGLGNGGSGMGGATSSSANSGGATTASSSSGGGVCTKPMDCGADSQCASWACESGMCVNHKAAEGTPCNNNTAVCDPMGACVGCYTLGAMAVGCNAGAYCFMGKCASCTNTTSNGDETDVDCGGGNCPACIDGKQCKVAADCASNTCDAMQMPPVCVSCTDGMLNGDEGDVDCGGSCPTPCGLGKKCKDASDCSSGECTNKKCTACANGAKDGDESDKDCGGTCPACPNGGACGVDGDCTSGACAGGVCCGGACAGQCKSCALVGHKGTCTNVPTGLDGSPSCGAGLLCESTVGACQAINGKKIVGENCAGAGACFGNSVCVASFCRFKNGDACAYNIECESGFCFQNTCKACMAADCGAGSMCVGGVCSGHPGDPCGNNPDCFGGICDSGFCSEAINNGSACTDNFDCKSRLCKLGTCQACTVNDCASCTMNVCKAPAGAACAADGQCATGLCAGTPFKHCK